MWGGLNLQSCNASQLLPPFLVWECVVVVNLLLFVRNCCICTSVNNSIFGLYIWLCMHHSGTRLLHLCHVEAVREPIPAPARRLTFCS